MNEHSSRDASFGDLRIPQSIQELAECFQPGIDDLAAPEFAPLARWLADNEAHQRAFDKLCALDQRIGMAFRQVDAPDPNDLQRIVSDAAMVERPVAKRSVWRRPATRWAAAIAATVVLGVLTVNFLPDRTIAYSSEQLAQFGLQWTQQIRQRRNWSIDLDAAPADRPVSDEIVIEHRSWMTLDTALDRKTAVYDFGLPQGRQAYLFVVAAPGAADLSPLFPMVPDYRTGKYSVGVCRHGDLVYVLVVEGSRRDYSSLLRERREPA